MERTIGKLFWLNIFIVCFAHAEIIMRITDEEGAQLESVGIGRPFNISVELKNLSNGLREPIIENLDAIEHYRSGVQMSTVNGNTSAVYTYKCRIDMLGTHAIGPATIPGTHESSQQIKIEVLEEPKYVRSHKKEDTTVLFRIFAQPELAVVGQKVKIITRFYTTDARMRLQNMTIPQMPAFKFIDKVGPTFGKETINGRAYEYTEWSIDLFAHEAGNHLVPAFCADYEYPSQSRFSMFSWGHFAQTKRVYSNSIRISVDPLPKGVRIDFVGTKATARASVNQSSAKVGEGILYTITFSGDGDIESVCAPKLCGISDSLKLYESKTSETPAASDRLASKQFEYVIQCVQEGSWEIPAQHFQVYDVQDRTVKTVSTSPARITILGDQNKLDKDKLNESQNNQAARPELAKDRKGLQDNNEDGPIRPLHTNDPWYPTPERGPINWSLFFMLVFAPCAYGIYGATRRRLVSKIEAKKRAKKAAVLALASLERAKKVKDYEAPYHIFITFLANIYEVKQAQISGDWIKQKIGEHASSESWAHEWDQFFASLTACAFGGAVDTTIFEATSKWIQNWKGLR